MIPQGELTSMNPTITKKDRFLGCFLGGAVGDALGYPVEFLSESHIRQEYGPEGIRIRQTVASVHRFQQNDRVSRGLPFRRNQVRGFLHGYSK